eukprot:CAMPEP_0202969280 /NCGR_PEP_ID=MMETSP1396-20130829/14953_1 /ASSEMBLY_ACC=CAM_ASM_000872 /TAXON_ID= /ORGANISM="Pseudokeronopsis sp., Strain Brazil" /LENGTH=70 /DNA_ID=CAMNT_0049696639 /DNA_START=403 /DNA_END=615 /DNA_ORIENTATION=+
MNFSNGVEFMNQVMTLERVVTWGGLVEEITGKVAGESSQERKFKPHIAFGTRVTEKPIIENKKQINNAMN